MMTGKEKKGMGTRLMLTLPVTLRARMEAEVNRSGLMLSEIARTAIDEWLRDRERDDAIVNRTATR